MQYHHRSLIIDHYFSFNVQWSTVNQNSNTAIYYHELPDYLITRLLDYQFFDSSFFGNPDDFFDSGDSGFGFEKAIFSNRYHTLIFSGLEQVGTGDLLVD